MYIYSIEIKTTETMTYIANQVKVEGLTRAEIIGVIEYINNCLIRKKEMEAWEAKEYKASLEHFLNHIEILTANYNKLVSMGANPVY